MGSNSEILPLIILLNIPGSVFVSEGVKVICSPQTICALRESAVDLQCSYSNTIKPQLIFWFTPKQKAKWRNKDDPEDLALDSDCAGRVTYNTHDSTSTLTIRDLREKDSGEYQLMIITETGKKYSSSTTLTLTVSDLQIKMISDTDKKWTLNCSTSCSLTSNFLFYDWYSNRQYKYSTDVDERPWSLYRPDSPGSYSCSISDHPEIRSSSVCVSGENCWSVIYSGRRVCVLEGSSVHFPCTYSYPSGLIVSGTFWMFSGHENSPKYLSVEERFAGRVEFLGDKERNCNLRISNVKKSDSGEYWFQFITNTAGGSFSGNLGVILSVTDLQVRVSPSSPSEGQTVTLTCISTCTLPNNPTYIWYKNGQPVTNKPTRYNKLYLDSASPEDVLQYSCALGASAGLEGPEDSTEFIITVAMAIVLTLILIMGLVWRWWVIRRKRGAEREADVQNLTPVDDRSLNPTTMSSDYDTLGQDRSSSRDLYSSLNPATMSSEYNTLKQVKGSSSDLYTSLNPATMSSEYDTLNNVTSSG